MATVVNVKEMANFNSLGFAPQLAMMTSKARLILLCLEAGQGIPYHPDAAEVVFICMKGKGVFELGDEKIPFSDGTLIHAPAGTPRGISAEEQTMAVAVNLGMG